MLDSYKLFPFPYKCQKYLHDFTFYHQVTIDGASVNLPHISRTISVVRRLHELEVTAKDARGYDLVSLTCWLEQRACVVSVSGWLHADTRGLLGNFNLNPADDFMRPSGKVRIFQFSYIFSPKYLCLSLKYGRNGT